MSFTNTNYLSKVESLGSYCTTMISDEQIALYPAGRLKHQKQAPTLSL